MQQHGNKYFACIAPPTSPAHGDRVKGQNSSFLEHGYVAYQIKGNHECTNIEANILPADPLTPPPPSHLILRIGSMGSIGQNSIF